MPSEIFIRASQKILKYNFNTNFHIFDTEYFKQTWRYPNQNPDQPYFLVTASSGKAATGINGITLNSACHLPVK